MRRGALAILLTICLCSFLVACGQPASDAATDTGEVQAEESVDLDSITLQKISEANTREAVFAKHKNYTLKSELQENDSDVVNSILYGVEGFYMYGLKDELYCDQSFIDDEDGLVRQEQILTADNQVYKTYVEDEEPYYIYSWFLVDNNDELPDLWQIGYFAPLRFPEDADEKLIKTEDNGDGTISVYTSAPIDVVSEVTFVPEGFENAELDFIYILDTDTLEAKALSVSILNEGESIPYFNQEFEYDVEEPEGYKELSDNLKNTKIVASDGEDGKTFTVTYDPGTDKEKTYQQTFVRDLKISIILKDGYERYSDPEGKQPYQGSDGKSDVTIYALK